MMKTATQVIESLKADEIRRRLEDLDRESRALRVLLRAATRLERRGHRADSANTEGQPDA